VQVKSRGRVDAATWRIGGRQEGLPIEGKAPGTAQRRECDEAGGRVPKGRAHLHRARLQVQQRPQSIPAGAHSGDGSRLRSNQLSEVRDWPFLSCSFELSRYMDFFQ
jgi:hypothetical protein